MRHRRNHKKQARKTGFEQKLTHDQGLALIPGGAVSAQRGTQDEIGLETRSSTKKGSPIVTGQYVSTLVRKLLDADHITLNEAAAAWAYEYDADMAYGGSSNILASLQVDGRGGDGTQAMVNKADHAARFRRANAYLRPEMAAIAQAGILQHKGPKTAANFTAIGADIMPLASRQDQAVAGRALLVFTLQNLAVFYGKRNPRKTHIIFEE